MAAVSSLTPLPVAPKVCTVEIQDVSISQLGEFKKREGKQEKCSPSGTIFLPEQRTITENRPLGPIPYK
jgi:hypothetical protein